MATLGAAGSINEAMWNTVFGVTDAMYPMSLDTCIAGYTRWIAAVKAHVPADKLLVYNVRQGWPALCAFLEIAPDQCPDTPFPRVNDSALLHRLIWALTFVSDYLVPIAAALATLLALLLWGLARFCCRRPGRPTAKKAD